MIGGEPMLHPDLVRLMKYVTSHGMTTGMTTNGFLLTEDRLKEMMDAGMGRIQISLDALNPTPGTPKSLKTLRKKIEMVAKHPIWFRVNTVICEQTVDEVEEVAEFCMNLGVPVNFSVVHNRGRLTKSLNNPLYLDRVRWLKEQKLKGRPISTNYFLIDYYEKALEGQPMEWTCQAGNKCYYVSPDGNFHYCFHVAPQMPFAEMTREILAGNRGKKGCEENCGVDCVLSTSLPYSNLGTVALRRGARQPAADPLAAQEQGRGARRPDGVGRGSPRRRRVLSREHEDAVHRVVPGDGDHRRDDQLRDLIGQPAVAGQQPDAQRVPARRARLHQHEAPELVRQRHRPSP